MFWGEDSSHSLGFGFASFILSRHLRFHIRRSIARSRVNILSVSGCEDLRKFWRCEQSQRGRLLKAGEFRSICAMRRRVNPSKCVIKRNSTRAPFDFYRFPSALTSALALALTLALTLTFVLLIKISPNLPRPTTGWQPDQSGPATLTAEFLRNTSQTFPCPLCPGGYQMSQRNMNRRA